MSEVGHLSNDEAGKFCVDLIKNGTERILLAHLSKENNFLNWLTKHQREYLLRIILSLDRI